MSSTTAYGCDGPNCRELTHKDAGMKFPSAWVRLSVRAPGGHFETGAFHSLACAENWIAQWFPKEGEAIPMKLPVEQAGA